MPVTLPSTNYYIEHLAELHRQLIVHEITRNYLSGSCIRFDGVELNSEDRITLPSGAELSTLEFAHLFSVFDGSRVHKQAEKIPSRDDAPPRQGNRT